MLQGIWLLFRCLYPCFTMGIRYILEAVNDKKNFSSQALQFSNFSALNMCM